MKKRVLLSIILLLAVFLNINSVTYQLEKRPTGFASVPGEGVNEVTGGEGGQVIHIQSIAELETELGKLRTDKPKNNPVPTVFVFSGNYTYKSKMLYVKYIENVTFVGDGSAEFQQFGLIVQYASNIIIRNITFNGMESISSKSSDDGICIEYGSHHIWVDHCSFTDYYDGCLDSKKQAHNITISWNHFYNHSKNCLVGHDDGETADAIMTLTFHHNYFEGSEQRNPRVRFGKCHVYNNLYTNNSIYGIVSACNAQVMVEGNYMENVAHPSHCGYQKSPIGNLAERDNYLVNSGTFEIYGTVFEPSDYYSYTLDEASALQDYIPNYVGAGKIDFSYMWGGTTSVSSVQDELGRVVSETYYNLNGFEVSKENANGMVIRKVVYENGQTKSEKIYLN